MAATKTSKKAKDGASPQGIFDFAFLDPGDGSGLSPTHALVSAAGAIISPATADAQAQILSALGGLMTNATGLAIKAAILAQLNITDSVWKDSSGAYYIRRDSVQENADGTSTVTPGFFDPQTGASVTPGAGLAPGAGGAGGGGRSLVQAFFDATAGGTGYSTGDVLGRIVCFDTSQGIAAEVWTSWINVSQSAAILPSAPTAGTYQSEQQNLSIGHLAGAGDVAIAAGGTAQVLFGGAAPANGWKICNPDPGEDLWVSDSTTAGPNALGSFRIPPGGIVTTEPGEKPCGPVSVYGATTGHVVTARKW